MTRKRKPLSPLDQARADIKLLRSEAERYEKDRGNIVQELHEREQSEKKTLQRLDELRTSSTQRENAQNGEINRLRDRVHDLELELAHTRGPGVGDHVAAADDRDHPSAAAAVIRAAGARVRSAAEPAAAFVRLQRRRHQLPQHERAAARRERIAPAQVVAPMTGIFAEGFDTYSGHLPKLPSDPSAVSMTSIVSIRRRRSLWRQFIGLFTRPTKTVALYIEYRLSEGDQGWHVFEPTISGVPENAEELALTISVHIDGKKQIDMTHPRVIVG